MRVCVCVYMCVSISFRLKGFSLLNKTINVVPEVQVSDGVLRKYLCQVPLLPRHRQSL